MLPAEGPIPLGLLVAIQIIQGILLSPLINSLFTFGEEFGWRGYLQPKLMPLGGRRAMLLMGVIWGLWHAPVIAMGHNYGFGYPGAPWTGILAMIWFTTVAGTFLGWASLRGESVWPAVLGHAGINGIASLAVLFTQGEPNPLLGPLGDNGGETLTHMPSAGSPALNAGNAAPCAAVSQVDQRSYARNVGLCDLGAVERGAEPQVTFSIYLPLVTRQ